MQEIRKYLVNAELEPFLYGKCGIDTIYTYLDNEGFMICVLNFREYSYERNFKDALFKTIKTETIRDSIFELIEICPYVIPDYDDIYYSCCVGVHLNLWREIRYSRIYKSV